MGKDKKEKRPKSDSESDSDSDSGPDDRNEPAPKKSKSGGSGAKRLKNDAGETYFELERTRRVSVREFRNKLMVDIREYYEKDGKYFPGKKGIALSASQWNKLKSLVSDIDEVIQEMS